MGALRVIQYTAFPLDETTEFLRVSNEVLYGTGQHYIHAFLNKRIDGYYWRIEYHTNDGVKTAMTKDLNYQPATEYKIETILKLGDTTGEVYLIINETPVISVTGISNNDVAQSINFIEVGFWWAPPNWEEYIYSVEIYGTPVIYHSVDGTIRDSETGLPIENAGVSIGTEYSVFTDISGYFTLTVPAGVYNLKVIKQGYDLVIAPIDISTGDLFGIEIMLTPSIPQGGIVFNVRSITVMPYWFGEDGFASPLMDELLTEIRQKFGNLVTHIDIRINWKIDPNDPNNVLFSDQNGEFTLEEIQAGINKIHAHGYKVLLGHVEEWADPTPFAPTNIPLFIQNLGARCVEVATFAQSLRVENFHYLWELHAPLIDGTHNSEWTTIIQNIRSVYSGKLAFELNWFYNETQYQSYIANDWLSLLDYIAISFYFPPVSTCEPMLSQIIEGYTSSNNPERFNIMDYISNLSTIFNKKILLNCGFSSADCCGTRPWTSTSAIPDESEQALLWRGLFEAWKTQPYILGFDMEHYSKPYIETDTTSSFRGKLAETTIIEQLQTVSPPKPTTSLPLLLLVGGVVLLSLGKKK